MSFKSCAFDIKTNDIVKFNLKDDEISNIESLSDIYKLYIISAVYDYIYEYNYNSLLRVFDEKDNTIIWFNEFIKYNSIRTKTKLIRCLNLFKKYIYDYLYDI